MIAAAERAAQKDLVANYRGCHLPANLIYDTETNGGMARQGNCALRVF